MLGGFSILHSKIQSNLFCIENQGIIVFFDVSFDASYRQLAIKIFDIVTICWF